MSFEALYVHIPFCVRKCGYCDFYSEVGSEEDAQRFLQAIEAECRMRVAAHGSFAPKTVFFGGGTPTKLTAPQLKALGEILHRHFDFSQVTEWTSEINPGTLGADKAYELKTMGVNRASFGVQSFDPHFLHLLDRAHEAGKVEEALMFAQAAGITNLSVDLMFALPGQTFDQWQSDLTRALELPVNHISLYNLTYEDDTPLTEQMARGEVDPLPEDEQEAMYRLAIEASAAKDLLQYEVSNFAKPGRECAHNLLYWRCADWLGIGPGAHSALDGKRWGNARDHRAYAKALLDENRWPTSFEEDNDIEARSDEVIMMGLRLTSGVRDLDHKRLTGLGLQDRCGPMIDMLADEGLLEWDGENLRCTPKGMLVLDTLIVELTRTSLGVG